MAMSDTTSIQSASRASNFSSFNPTSLISGLLPSSQPSQTPINAPAPQGNSNEKMRTNTPIIQAGAPGSFIPQNQRSFSNSNWPTPAAIAISNSNHVSPHVRAAPSPRTLPNSPNSNILQLQMTPPPRKPFPNEGMYGILVPAEVTLPPSRPMISMEEFQHKSEKQKIQPQILPPSPIIVAAASQTLNQQISEIRAKFPSPHPIAPAPLPAPAIGAVAVALPAQSHLGTNRTNSTSKKVETQNVQQTPSQVLAAAPTTPEKFIQHGISAGANRVYESPYGGTPKAHPASTAAQKASSPRMIYPQNGQTKNASNIQNLMPATPQSFLPYALASNIPMKALHAFIDQLPRGQPSPFKEDIFEECPTKVRGYRNEEIIHMELERQGNEHYELKWKEIVPVLQQPVMYTGKLVYSGFYTEARDLRGYLHRCDCVVRTKMYPHDFRGYDKNLDGDLVEVPRRIKGEPVHWIYVASAIVTTQIDGHGQNNFEITAQVVAKMTDQTTGESQEPTWDDVVDALHGEIVKWLRERRISMQLWSHDFPKAMETRSQTIEEMQMEFHEAIENDYPDIDERLAKLLRADCLDFNPNSQPKILEMAQNSCQATSSTMAGQNVPERSVDAYSKNTSIVPSVQQHNHHPLPPAPVQQCEVSATTVGSVPQINPHILAAATVQQHGKAANTVEASGANNIDHESQTLDRAHSHARNNIQQSVPDVSSHTQLQAPIGNVFQPQVDTNFAQVFAGHAHPLPFARHSGATPQPNMEKPIANMLPTAGPQPPSQKRKRAPSMKKLRPDISAVGFEPLPPTKSNPVGDSGSRKRANSTKGGRSAQKVRRISEGVLQAIQPMIDGNLTPAHVHQNMMTGQYMSSLQGASQQGMPTPNHAAPQAYDRLPRHVLSADQQIRQMPPVGSGQYNPPMNPSQLQQDQQLRGQGKLENPPANIHQPAGRAPIQYSYQMASSQLKEVVSQLYPKPTISNRNTARVAHANSFPPFNGGSVPPTNIPQNGQLLPSCSLSSGNLQQRRPGVSGSAPARLDGMHSQLSDHSGQSQQQKLAVPAAQAQNVTQSRPPQRPNGNMIQAHGVPNGFAHAQPLSGNGVGENGMPFQIGRSMSEPQPILFQQRSGSMNPVRPRPYTHQPQNRNPAGPGHISDRSGSFPGPNMTEGMDHQQMSAQVQQCASPSDPTTSQNVFHPNLFQPEQYCPPEGMPTSSHTQFSADFQRRKNAALSAAGQRYSPSPSSSKKRERTAESGRPGSAVKRRKSSEKKPRPAAGDNQDYPASHARPNAGSINDQPASGGSTFQPTGMEMYGQRLETLDHGQARAHVERMMSNDMPTIVNEQLRKEYENKLAAQNQKWESRMQAIHAKYESGMEAEIEAKIAARLEAKIAVMMEARMQEIQRQSQLVQCDPTPTLRYSLPLPSDNTKQLGGQALHRGP